ncbi:MAG: DNA polymerase III subunit gamma/tau [Candidatus Uhrbacteria bacterium]|nr:DNA polymerase III subunit gamma/tau [Candidatus Uhrbacteria bacterium]
MPSLSQKYRPKTFAEITGQRHVTETLRKEVATGVLGHAYLFSGPRGVGKTTTARVFAKALNCEKPNDGEPCNTCVPCQAANEGRWLDLIELDAATHTGVDMVREAIIEHARFSPNIGKRKIYVLDEAHMLSGASWNALLKTLEEPPAYAFFILATTEWHRVPATIVSRCQRFEFRRIADQELATRVKELATLEGWKIADDVTDLIVSRSEGCVRDAETLLGQLGSLGESTITMDLAGLVIPPSHLPLAEALMELWANRDHSAALAEAQRLFDEGIPLLPLFDDLLLIVRRQLVASGQPDASTAKFSPAELNDLALLLFERRRDVKAGVDPLFALQLAGTVVTNGMLKHGGQKQESGSGKQESDSSVIARRDPSSNSGQAPQSPTVSKSETTEIAALSLVARNDDSKMLDLATVRRQWNAIVRAVDEKNHSIPFILKISRPEEVRGHTVVIRFQYAFHRDKILSDHKHRSIVEACMRQVLEDPGLIIEGMVGESTDTQEERPYDMATNILKAFGGSVVE